MPKRRYTVGMEGRLEAHFDLDSDVECERRLTEALDKRTMVEPEVLNLILRLVGPGQCVMDIGANAGWFTVFAGLVVGPTGSVIAVEPGRAVLPTLRRNIEINKLTNVEIVEQPLADTARDVTFCTAAEGDSFSCVWDDATPHDRFARETATLRATTVDAVLAGRTPGPALIKMDAEGAEHQIMKGAYDTLFKHKVPFIISELADVNLMRLRSSATDLRRYMYLMGYDTWIIYHNAAFPKWVPPTVQLRGQYVLNVLFAARDDVALFWTTEEHEPQWVAR